MDEKFVDDAPEWSYRPENQHVDTEVEEAEMEVAAAPDVDVLQDARIAATNAATAVTSPGTVGAEGVAGKPRHILSITGTPARGVKL